MFENNKKHMVNKLHRKIAGRHFNFVTRFLTCINFRISFLLTRISMLFLILSIPSPAEEIMRQF